MDAPHGAGVPKGISASENLRLEPETASALAKLDYLSDGTAAAYLHVSVAAVRTWRRAHPPKKKHGRRVGHTGSPKAGLSEATYYASGATVAAEASISSNDLRRAIMRQFERIARARKINLHEAAFACGRRP